MVSVIFKHQFCASFPRLLSAWASFGVLDRHDAALDGALGAAAGNTLLCPRCVPGLLEILDFPASF